jgi:hypothetical protein
VTNFPRPLSPRERLVLDHLLSGEFPGVEALRTQALGVLVEGRGVGPTVFLVVPESDAPLAEVVNEVPVEAWSVHQVDSDDFVQILLFVHEGRLSALELNWYENLPVEFPPPSELRPPRPYSGDYSET